MTTYQYVSLNGPDGNDLTMVHGINDAGQVAGAFEDSSGQVHGFVYSGGTYTILNGPDGNDLTMVYGANGAGQVAGAYNDSSGQEHGFVYSGGTYTILNGPDGNDRATYAYGIDDAGQVAGTYVDSSGQEHGFVASSNYPPVATADVSGTEVGGSIGGNVLSNDTDADGDKLAVTGIDAGSSHGTVGQALAGKYGTLVLNSDGSYNYSADSHLTLSGHNIAQDTFTYTESDGHGGIASAALTITITQEGQTYIAGTAGTDSSHLGSVSGGNGQTVLDGSLGFEKISGGNGADVLIGGNGDVLNGGNGPDTFIFKGDFGSNEIVDFNAKNDVIQLNHNDFLDFASILKNASYDATTGATTITDGTHGTIVLDHVNLTDLKSGDFLFV